MTYLTLQTKEPKMFERYTERARQTVVLAQDLARQFNHEHITSGHLLLGLAAEEDGLAARILDRLDFEPSRALQILRVMNPSQDKPSAVNMAFTPEAKKALELCLRDALELGHNYIGTEHVLLGLSRQTDTPAHALLADQDIAFEQIRELTIHILQEGRFPEEKERPDVVTEAVREAVDSSESLQEAASMQESLQDLITQVFQQMPKLNDRPAPFLQPNPTFTVDDIRDIGQVALSSIDIVGLGQDYREGYSKLADACSHILNLVHRDTVNA